MTAKERYMLRVKDIESEAIKEAKARIALRQWNKYSNSLLRKYGK